MTKNQRACAIATVLLVGAPSALAFEISFEWGKTRECSSGKPYSIDNPAFELGQVPNGTAKIKFRMKDRQSSYHHGGGNVAYSGQSVIEPGAFTYDGPCPPFGAHTYEWTATAVDAAGKKLGKAKAKRKFPE